MKSKLFQKLAALPGVNWFNRKEKIEYAEPAKELPKIVGDESWIKLSVKAQKYFSHIQALKQYISTMHKLIGEFDDAIANLDEEYFLLEAKNESTIIALKNEIKSRDAKIKELEHKLEKKLPISRKDIQLLIDKMNELKDSEMYRTRMKNKRNFGRMHNYFHNFLVKMGEKYNGEFVNEKSGPSSPL